MIERVYKLLSKLGLKTPDTRNQNYPMDVMNNKQNNTISLNRMPVRFSYRPSKTLLLQGIGLICRGWV